jgi:hypothetical protein
MVRGGNIDDAIADYRRRAGPGGRLMNLMRYVTGRTAGRQKAAWAGGLGAASYQTFKNFRRGPPKAGPLASGYRAFKRRKRAARAFVASEPQDGKSFTRRGGKCFVSRQVLAMAAPNVYVLNVGSEQTCGIGVQNNVSYVLGSTGDLNTIAQKVTDGVSTAGICYLESMSHNLKIVNTSTYNTNMTIRDLVPRRDIYTGAIASPEAAWATGIVDELAAGLATDIGAKPIMSDLFNQYFEVINTVKVHLRPGANHEHTVLSKACTKLQTEVVSRVTGTLKGLGIYTMITIEGGPAHDSTTKTTVSTSACGIDIVRALNYHFKFIVDNNVNYYRANNLTGTFAVGGEIINEELGEVQNAAGLTATAGVY